MQVVNSDADLLSRHVEQMASRFHHTTKILLLTLALCIGANTAIFSIIDATLSRPLPYPEPDRLVNVWHRPSPTRPPSATAMMEAVGYVLQGDFQLAEILGNLDPGPARFGDLFQHEAGLHNSVER